MRLAKITTFYPAYLNEFYKRHSALQRKSFEAQNAALNHDAFAWFDVWSHALAPLGYDVLEVTANAAPLQLRWAKEQGLRTQDLGRIAIEQVARFRPDVIWFEDSDAALLREIKARLPGKLILGWTGSPLSSAEHFREMDLVLSCAPEAVSRLQDRGLRAQHLHHAFDPRILTRLDQSPRSADFIFIGQIIRGSEFHSAREQLLLALANQNLITIYSPTRHQPVLDLGIRASRRLLKEAMQRGLPDRLLRKIPVLERLIASDALPFTVDRRLRRVLKPGVFGLSAYQLIRNSAGALNIHANSSPRFASNMRMFEITGVGTCMLTDWKENLPSLFAEDTEILSYRTREECVEKARWLIEHREQRQAIGDAAQKRILREHTYAHRARELDVIIRRELAQRKG
jgi:hypothetical protein